MTPIIKSSMKKILFIASILLVLLLIMSNNSMSSYYAAQEQAMQETENMPLAIDSAIQSDPCISTDEQLGDSASWSINAMKLFAHRKYEQAINLVDDCFSRWAPEAGHAQKAMYESDAQCPPIGKVDKRAKTKIEKNYLINDVSLALWAKSRSLHKLGLLDKAKSSYSQCIYMSCGRVWDPKGWYWSPAKDCATEVQKML